MSGYRLPAPHGAWLDRTQPLSFKFNTRRVAGFGGDTMASALLAQGFTVVSRSYKLHRPRGIFSCGVEEPNGIADVGLGQYRTPNTRLTETAAHDAVVATSGNCWPSLEFDLGSWIGALAAFMPTGFYYKTFMRPNWKLFEPVIRRLAAAGVAADAPDPQRYDEVAVKVDVLVVGAGAAGMQAALAAARTGRQVLLLEAEAQPGGWLATQTSHSSLGAGQRIAQLRSELAAAGVVVQVRSTAVAWYDHNLISAIESLEARQPAGALRERLWKIRAGQIILATGCFERPVLFPNNDLPGVMLAGAVERYATHYGVACGRRVIISAACDSAYGVAESLQDAGIGVAAIVERRARHEVGAAPPQGVEVMYASALVGVDGRNAVQRVRVAGVDGLGARNIDADLVASAGGFTPNINLYSQAGGSLRWVQEAAMFVPKRQICGVAVVGAAAGVFELDLALEHAAKVGRAAPGSIMPEAPVGGIGQISADTRPSAKALATLKRRPGKIFVDLQNDVTSADVELAARENYRSVEHLKRYTALGMATDQGKTSNVNGLIVMGQASARRPEEVGTTRFRPPYKPVTLNAMVGGRCGARYRPLKTLNARDWHMARGALFEEFGGWERPACYPRAGENLLQAAEREAWQVRQSVGLFEGSPLGKIEIYGPDAADFLDLMYVGTMSTIPVGGARYGALLNENGTVIDDGIVARLGQQHFWINTTSGGAERVALGFEEWLQCEFVKHRVLVVPITSQWGNVTVAGPSAWKLLSRIGMDPSLAPATMKHMAMREVSFEGQTLRVLRASFSGELGYEINLPPAQTEAMLQRLWDAGQELGVCCYGIEALMIMRLEKGFLHVGADTDGTTLPQDVGLARAVAKKSANFVGRRSLTRPAGQDPERMQLVGLQPLDRRTRLPVGAHLAITAPPATAQGFITSSAYSPALQQPVAMAMLQRGSQRVGERLQAWSLGTMIEAEVVKLPFLDPAGERLHG